MKCFKADFYQYFAAVKKIYIFIFLCSVLSCFSQDKTYNYITKHKNLAIIEMNRYNIPASITLAQGILESGNGESRLATEGKNHFGIKCHDNWNGKTILEDDDKKGECFRKYDKVLESYRDHSLFLTERGRYSFLFEYKRTDYKSWAKGLKEAGYATNPNYSQLLINLIEKYNLNKYDKEIKKEKRLFFAHSYGLPYLTGTGAYYFNKKLLYFIDINTSFAFTDASVGYNCELLNNFYIGSNTGVIYLPFEESKYLPHFSAEIIYKREKIRTVLIKGGVQVPLLGHTAFLGNNFVPYFRLTYLLP